MLTDLGEGHGAGSPRPSGGPMRSSSARTAFTAEGVTSPKANGTLLLSYSEVEVRKLGCSFSFSRSDRYRWRSSSAGNSKCTP
jgi:hypothetical protein